MPGPGPAGLEWTEFAERSGSAQSSQGCLLDLADTLLSDAQYVGDFLECLFPIAIQAIADTLA